MPFRHRGILTTFALVPVLAGTLVVTASAPASGGTSPGGSAVLAAALRQAIDHQDFKNVLDTTPPDLSAPARRPAVAPDKDAAMDARPRPINPAAAVPIHQTPNMDAAVIELDDHGRATASADVVLSPQYPHGQVVPLNRNMFTDQVRYRWWDDYEWDHNNGLGTRDVLPGRENAPIDFDSPYPGSVFKLMVGFELMRLVDQGRVSMDATYDYRPTVPKDSCGGPTSKKIGTYFDEMITQSKNESACALVLMELNLGALDEMNAEYVHLGLPTLMMTQIDPNNGGHWTGGNMSAVDAAKLLLLINGGSGVLWRAPDGTAVTRDVLSNASRQLYARTLLEQGHNDTLSTSNWCGRAYPAPGIPSVVAQRWINPAAGTVNVGGTYYGQDVRPCNAAAQVTMAHKTGWVDTTGADAAIVHSLPGKPKRNYIVVVFCNLGTDYIDVNRPADPAGVYPVPLTEKYGQLGLSIDRIVTALQS
ncbi:MAG TPA: serine hydrolase [Jatrophihabitantaceae bacterium]